jgi:hypothetical protein
VHKRSIQVALLKPGERKVLEEDGLASAIALSSTELEGFLQKHDRALVIARVKL